MHADEIDEVVEDHGAYHVVVKVGIALAASEAGANAVQHGYGMGAGVRSDGLGSRLAL